MKKLIFSLFILITLSSFSDDAYFFDYSGTQFFFLENESAKVYCFNDKVSFSFLLPKDGRIKEFAIGYDVPSYDIHDINKLTLIVDGESFDANAYLSSGNYTAKYMLINNYLFNKLKIAKKIALFFKKDSKTVSSFNLDKNYIIKINRLSELYFARKDIKSN